MILFSTAYDESWSPTIRFQSRTINDLAAHDHDSWPGSSTANDTNMELLKQEASPIDNSIERKL